MLISYLISCFTAEVVNSRGCVGTVILRGRQSQKLLYENLPVQTKTAILSRRLILLAILLYEQFIHHSQIYLCPNKELLST